MKVTFDTTAHACVRTDKQGQLYIDMPSYMIAGCNVFVHG